MPNLPHTRPDHDETLIARLAVDDFANGDRDRDRATALAAECPACAELLVDLRTIAEVTAALPAPRRTRDFRLTEADAARLRPTGWRGAMARLASPDFAFTRPLAAGLATLGVAGLLLVSLPSSLGGSAASMPEAAHAPAAGNAVGGPSAAPPYSAPSSALAPALAQPQPAATARDTVGTGAPPAAGASSGGAGVTAEDGAGSEATGGSKGAASPALDLGTGPSAQADGTAGRVSTASPGPTTSGGPAPLAIVSVVLLAAGIGLWLLRSAARRLA